MNTNNINNNNNKIRRKENKTGFVAPSAIKRVIKNKMYKDMNPSLNNPSLPTCL